MFAFINYRIMKSLSVCLITDLNGVLSDTYLFLGFINLPQLYSYNTYVNTYFPFVKLCKY